MNDAINSNELDGFQPIEEDDQMEYGFLDEAMDDEDEDDVSDDDREDEDVEVVDDDPDGLDAD
ncbi:MAG: hypothetical protein CMJ40_04850 [Phycisphaerae bacterium]|mgnify:CR=1 FL=1|nr:hypothetical protein [Phycisphaerae bacterium]|tara:strand:- start:1977 stop:2165 length:189 start_codon:yes stop_codon:yes gene_type:complete